MAPQYYMQLTIQTDQGPQPFGRFDLGADRDFALFIWNELQGDADVIAHIPLLQMEWIEADLSLPVEFRIKGCTLAQLLHNTATITKALFSKNLGGNQLSAD